MNIIHILLVLLHTAAGIISLVTGILVIKLKRTGWLFESYIWPMVIMMGTLLLMLAWDWPVLTLVKSIIYIVVSLLSFYTVYRGFMGRQKQMHRYTGWWLEFVDDVGFTVVALFEILIIIGAIEMDLPVWAILLIAVVIALLGWKWLQYEKQHYIARRAERKAKKAGK